MFKATWKVHTVICCRTCLNRPDVKWQRGIAVIYPHRFYEWKVRGLLSPESGGNARHKRIHQGGKDEVLEFIPLEAFRFQAPGESKYLRERFRGRKPLTVYLLNHTQQVLKLRLIESLDDFARGRGKTDSKLPSGVKTESPPKWAPHFRSMESQSSPPS